MWRVCGHHADAEKEVQVAGALEVRWLQGRSRRTGSSAPPGCLRHQQCGQGAKGISPLPLIQSGKLCNVWFGRFNNRWFGNLLPIEV